jgi:hypothetical protein
MENGKIKSTLKRHTGPLKMVNSIIIKEDTCTLTSKSGKIRIVGGALLSRAMLKSTLKK